MKKTIIILLFILTGCNSGENKNKWVNDPTEIKYSKKREKEVWGKILRGDDKEIFYGTPVYDAASKIIMKDNEELKKIIANLSKEEINYQEDKFKTTLGHLSLRNENFEAIKLLIERGLNPNIISYDGASIMTTINNTHYSRLPNSLNTLKFIITNGGDVNLLNSNMNTLDRTPLIVASGSNIENTKLLIESGANPNFVYKDNPNDPYPETSLISALERKRIDIVCYLIFEAKVNYKIFKNTENVKYNSGGYQILGYLRTMTFALNTEEYRKKMKLVNYLSKEGLDYWNTPIPSYIAKGRTKEYLSKY
ncbi:ankyrin repeat domain-containing protein [Wenyingzhuangia aestuarii]|uniref:ankyrin repeat domain-containing protein n=1 Tax=Wenyingzhuangia aestuarii TaxID=1647582 RepID=UPI00143A0393|nr:ankyrin repeat domain-containing protein [Wenyingzhuangia aestuarii]NJB82063.1 hypothetical protein [Wenyingzhuangia aestuarii]